MRHKLDAPKLKLSLQMAQVFGYLDQEGSQMQLLGFLPLVTLCPLTPALPLQDISLTTTSPTS